MSLHRGMRGDGVIGTANRVGDRADKGPWKVLSSRILAILCLRLCTVRPLVETAPTFNIGFPIQCEADDAATLRDVCFELLETTAKCNPAPPSSSSAITSDGQCQGSVRETNRRDWPETVALIQREFSIGAGHASQNTSSIISPLIHSTPIEK